MTRFLLSTIGVIATLGILALVRLGLMFAEFASTDRDSIEWPTLPQIQVTEPMSEGVPTWHANVNRLSQGPDDALSDEVRIDELIHQSRAPTDLNSRLEAIAKLGDLKGPLVALTLRGFLDDPNPVVREEAIESLGALGGTSGVAGLAYATSDEDEVVRRLAIEVLAEVGSDEAIGALSLVLGDEDPELRELAVEELAAVGTDTAVLVLQSFLSDSDRRVRESAFEYSGRSSGRDTDLR